MKKFVLLLFTQVFILSLSNAQEATNLRRVVSPQQPMWLIHIDTWNYPDPQKIIDLVPKDIRPYVVMNISLSISHDEDTYRFQRAEYGYELAKSWLRVCAENRMWAMIQQASGGYSHFPDNEMEIYEEFFRDYPNFLGFNYAEQFWGFDEPNNPLSPKWSDRMSHFAKLLELSNTYGGYLVVSICWNQWGQGVNPIGMLKRSPEFAAACSKYAENYILFDKHTQVSFLSDRESMCLGAYLSGYSGNYGIRYDDTGWTDGNGNHRENFSMATYSAPFLEHSLLTGLTAFDGPELIWTQCFREGGAIETSDGYRTRNWETFPQFDNVSVDLFRKILDGTVRIPDRKEVIERTKFALIQDVNSGNSEAIYSSPVSLYSGLYRMGDDGAHENNWSFFKKTGRYPTIPIVYGLNDSLAQTIEFPVNQSDFYNRWSSVSQKVEEFNQHFPKEYSGDIYAGRNQNKWVIYNPYKKEQVATGTIPFKYNTCDSLGLELSRYTSGIVNEDEDDLTIYLNNFDNSLNTNLKPDIIKVYGCLSEPEFIVIDRGNNHKSQSSGDWSDGVFTLLINHNGPVDVEIKCSGTNTNRLKDFLTANVTVPNSPTAFTGPLEHEAETFDYKNINEIIKNGYYASIRNYTGQGYLNFGRGATASVRDQVKVLNDGTYLLQTKYTVEGSDINAIDIYVNGIKIATPVFSATANLSNWAVNSLEVPLNKGVNTIEYKATSSLPANFYIDNFVIVTEESSNRWLEAECASGSQGWDLVTDETASNGKYFSPATTADSAALQFNFEIVEAANFKIWARMHTTADNSSMLLQKVDTNEWTTVELTAGIGDWAWVLIDSLALSKGEHRFYLNTVSKEINIDKLLIADTFTVPSSKGGPASNCSVDNQDPIAYAGSDLTFIDTDADSIAEVQLSSVGSLDPDGEITSFEWSEGDQVLSIDAHPTLQLAVGIHVITLKVTDAQGAFDTDELTVTILESSYEENNIWLEAECGLVGENWEIIPDDQASNGHYVTVRPGTQSLNSGVSDDFGLVKLDFQTASAGNYIVYGRLNCPSADDDSFWLKMDNSSFANHNGLGTSGWQWKELSQYDLAAGEHTLLVSYREDGALLDKLFITKYNELPSGFGETAINACEIVEEQDTTSVVDLNDGAPNQIQLQNYPNPFSISTNIEYNLPVDGFTKLYLLGSNGQHIGTLVNKYQSKGVHRVNWSPNDIPSGIYFYRLETATQCVTKKMIYQK